MPSGIYPRKIKTIKERFESKYRVNQETGCWEWTAGVDRDGYGRLGVAGSMALAHRVSYELYKGPIPEGLQALHTCVGNRACVNPDHLYLGTPGDNTKDKLAQGRQPRGSDAGPSKLTELQVIEIRELYALGKYTQECIAKMFGVRQMAVSDIVLRKSWKHVT